MKNKLLIKKPFIFAFWAGVIALALILVNFLLKSELIVTVMTVLGIIATLFVFYGVYALGVKYKSKKIRVTSIIVIILFLVFSIGFNVLSHSGFDEKYSDEYKSVLLKYGVEYNESMEDYEIEYKLSQLSEEEQQQFFRDSIVVLKPLLSLLIFVVLFGLFFIINFVFMAVGFIQIDKKVKYSKVYGVLMLVALGLAITMIGIFLAIPLFVVAEVFKLTIFYNEAKKAKEI